MDASQYKDYVLVLLFIRYITEYSSLLLLEKRELLIACSILPKNEKHAWMSNLPKCDDFLDKELEENDLK
jgi:hypothetical protein